MKLQILLILLFVTSTCAVRAQGIIVNPDGTHSVVHGSSDPNAPKVIVNSNGTHSVVLPGAIPVVVNSDGTHSVLVGFNEPNSTGIIVHSSGKHSVVHRSAGHTVVVGSDGTHKVIMNSSWASWLPHTNGLVQAALHCHVAMLWMPGLIW